MRICQKLSARPDRLSIQKRLTYSNILMFLIPVAVTLISALGAQVPAFRTLEEVREEREKSGATAVEDPAQSENGSGFKGREHECKLMLRQLAPIGTGTKAAFARLALLARRVLRDYACRMAL